MPKRGRRVPRYLSEDPAWREAESRRQFGIPRDAIPADPEQQVPQGCPVPASLLHRLQVHVRRTADGSKCGPRSSRDGGTEVAKGPLYSRAVRCRDCREAHDTAMRGTPRKTHFERRLRGGRLSRGCSGPAPRAAEPFR